MARYFVKKLVGRHFVGGVEQYEELRVVGVKLKFKLIVAIHCCTFVAQFYVPQHAAHVDIAGIKFAPRIEAFDVGGRVRGEVGVGIALQHLGEHFLKSLRIVLRDVSQRIDKHELR